MKLAIFIAYFLINLGARVAPNCRSSQATNSASSKPTINVGVLVSFPSNQKVFQSRYDSGTVIEAASCSPTPLRLNSADYCSNPAPLVGWGDPKIMVYFLNYFCRGWAILNDLVAPLIQAVRSTCSYSDLTITTILVHQLRLELLICCLPSLVFKGISNFQTFRIKLTMRWNSYEAIWDLSCYSTIQRIILFYFLKGTIFLDFRRFANSLEVLWWDLLWRQFR